MSPILEGGWGGEDGGNSSFNILNIFPAFTFRLSVTAFLFIYMDSCGRADAQVICSLWYLVHANSEPWKEKNPNTYMFLGKVCSRVTKTSSPPPPPSGKEVNGTQSCPKFQILSIFSRNIHFEEKCHDTKNVPDNISYLTESSTSSLRLILSLKRRQKYVYFAEICEKYDIFPIVYITFLSDIDGKRLCRPRHFRVSGSGERKLAPLICMSYMNILSTLPNHNLT